MVVSNLLFYETNGCKSPKLSVLIIAKCSQLFIKQQNVTRHTATSTPVSSTTVQVPSASTTCLLSNNDCVSLKPHSNKNGGKKKR